MQAARVMTFVATADAVAARAFYEGVLGFRLLEDTPFALVFDMDGVSLRVQKVEVVTPAPYTVLGWDVDDIAREVRGLVDAGVRFERFGFAEQDELGVWTTPDGAKVAWFKDPDGSILSLTQAAGRVEVGA